MPSRVVFVLLAALAAPAAAQFSDQGGGESGAVSTAAEAAAGRDEAPVALTGRIVERLRGES